MSKRAKIIIILGILTAATPFLGFPGTIKSGIVVVLGLGIASSMYWAEKRVSVCADCGTDTNDSGTSFEEHDGRTHLATTPTTQQEAERATEGNINGHGGKRAENPARGAQTEPKHNPMKLEVREE